MKGEGEPTRFFSIPNWEEYQHYKDRDPPWIKLHTKILESYELSLLPDAAKAHLMLIWLLASRLNNRIPLDADWIGKQISANEPVDLELLAEAGFICEAAEEDTERVRWPSRHISEKLRSKLLRSAAGVCTACGEESENLEIDHIVPVSKGGESVEGNLQVLCRSCNRRKRTSTGLRSKLLRSDTALRSLETEAERETKTETEREGKKIAREESHAAKPAQRRKQAERKAPETQPTWEAYCDVFRERYDNKLPLRNVKVNSQIKEFVGRVGVELAPDVIRYYVRSNNPLYVRQRHNVGLLVKHAEAIYTEFMTGHEHHGNTRLEETAGYNYETLKALEERREGYGPERARPVRRIDSDGGDAARPKAACE